MPDGKITQKQQQVLDFMKAFVREKGFPPSVREICEGVNLRSTSSVFMHIEGLIKHGYIAKDDFKSRGYRFLDEEEAFYNTAAINLPVVGQVAAGMPILAEQNIDSYFPVPQDRVPGGKSFILKVKGDSMINIGIMNGDCILVKECNTVNNGDVCVALIDDSATVKTFYKENGHIRLQPENDTMDPIIVDDCVIIGKVFGVYRFF
jgi:repressor LexA